MANFLSTLYPVAGEEGKHRKKAIKASNVNDVPCEDLVKVVRLSARGETGGRSWKVLLFPRNHPMFSSHGEHGNSPAMALCGVPLVLEKTEPEKTLTEWHHFDCQFATYLMLNPVTGFAPHDWDMYVGPVLAYRPGGLDLGDADMALITDWISDVVDDYADEAFHFRKKLNPHQFHKYKEMHNSQELNV